MQSRLMTTTLLTTNLPFVIGMSVRVCIALLRRPAGQVVRGRQLVEEVVHGAEHLGLVGIEEVVIGVGQTDHLS